MSFRLHTLSLIALVCVGCSDATRSNPSASLSVVSGGGSSDTILAVAATPLVVEVRDSTGHPAVGVTVLFRSQFLPPADSETAERGVYVCPIQSPGCSSYDEYGYSVRYGLQDQTDSLGHARLSVQYGVIAGPTAVLVSVPTLGLSRAVPYHTLPGQLARVVARIADTAVYVGHSYELGASAGDRMGNPLPGNVTVRSANPAVVTVQSGRVTAMALGRGRIVMQFRELIDTAFVSIPPVGRLIAHDLDFTLLNTDGTERRSLIALHGPYETALPAWTADGSRIVFQEDSTSSVHLHWVDTLGARGAVFAPADDVVVSSQAGIAHDGKLFFSGASISGAGRIYSASLDGSAVAFVVDGMEPGPSPDGSHLAYVYGELLRIRDLSLATEFEVAEDASYPRWSPTGALIAYVSSPSFHVEVVRSDGTQPRAVGATAAYDNGVSWSPDGEWLVASQRGVSFRARDAQLELIRVSDGERLPIPWTRGLHEPVWRPF